jgi:plasmid stabilization system protein ParE
MTLEVRLRPEAELDLADAAYWYEGQQQGLGRQFVDEVLAVFSVIVETPRLHPVLH